MKNTFIQNKNYRFAISAGAFIITLSILWSIISRATNIFFLSNYDRLLATGLIFLISIFIFVLFLLNKKIYQFILTNIKGTGKTFIIINIFSTIFATVLFLSNLLPTVIIPINHILKIQPISADENVKNVVYIDSIIEMIHAPEIGSNLVDTANIQVTDGNYFMNDGEIILEEGAVLTYSSFYAGCVRIIFKTTPKSRKVFVQFDNKEENFLLYSTEEDQTEINLCSGYPFKQLSLKWKLISIVNNFLNIISLTSIFGFEIFLIFYKKRTDYF